MRCATLITNGIICLLFAILVVKWQSCNGFTTTSSSPATACGNTTCSAYSVCINGSCSCKVGWVLVGGACQDRDECTRPVCQGKGTCVNTIGSFRCTCLRGWGGNHCLDPDPNVTDKACLPGYVPPLCCQSGWTGSGCHTDIDECSNSSLNNCTGIHEQCRNERGRYVCDCDQGWEGPHCAQDVNECLSNPCKNNTNCINIDGSYNCQCAKGWTGPNCTADINECLTNPCANNGTCSNRIGSYSCKCVTGWEGHNCENGKDECLGTQCSNDTSDAVLAGYILGPIIGLFLIWLIAGLIVLIYVRITRRTENKQGSIDEIEVVQNACAKDDEDSRLRECDVQPSLGSIGKDTSPHDNTIGDGRNKIRQFVINTRFSWRRIFPK